MSENQYLYQNYVFKMYDIIAITYFEIYKTNITESNYYIRKRISLHELIWGITQLLLFIDELTFMVPFLASLFNGASLI